jgi:Uma2 family endonuclease
MVEPEIRSEATFSRLVPDVAAWRRSTTGWPDLDVTPILLVPEWVGEVLSPGTQAFDCGPKKDAYGLMGVAWLWIVDPERRLVETFSNVRGKMVTGPSFSGSDPVSGPPFDGLTQAVSRLFPSS